MNDKDDTCHVPWPTISAIGKVHISGIQLAVNSVIAIPMVQCSVEVGFVFSMAYSYKSRSFTLSMQEWL